MNSSDTMRLPRFLYVMKSLIDDTPIRNASGMPSRMYGSWFKMKWKPKSSTESGSSIGSLSGHGLHELPIVLGLARAEEVPTLPERRHLVEVDPRHDQLVAARRRAREHLALRIDDARAGDQLDTVLDAGLGDADDEAQVRVGAGAHAELVQIERQRRDRRVVADQDDVGALERERAVAFRIAAGLADRG